MEFNHMRAGLRPAPSAGRWIAPATWRFQGESNSHHLIDNQGPWPLDDGTRKNRLLIGTGPTPRIRASYAPLHYLGALRLGSVIEPLTPGCKPGVLPLALQAHVPASSASAPLSGSSRK